MLDKIDLNEDEQPFNPKLNETVVEFLSRQRSASEPEDYPEGTRFECRRCGDCCKWNYYKLASNQELIDQLYRAGPKYPNGYWVLIEEKINLYMPTWTSQGEAKLFHFDGNLPQKHIEFCWRTGRTHGYWVLDKNDKIVIYCPTACQHSGDDNHCLIYRERPQICREYQCGRHPI